MYSTVNKILHTGRVIAVQNSGRINRNPGTVRPIQTILNNKKTTKEALPSVDPDQEKFLYSAPEILALGDHEQKFLLQNIIPEKSTVVLAGVPDSGKSQFARQLCLEISEGHQTFIGLQLNTNHQRALYVATEDSVQATNPMLRKQLTGLTANASTNFMFLDANTLDPQEIASKIIEVLNSYSVDIVIVDSFGDAFDGHDTNSNLQMRKCVTMFNKIAQKYDCSVMIIHHINKAAYNQSPSQQHIQGGSGMVQKVRTALQLTRGQGNIKYLSVVKGNYTPSEYKTHAFELNFSEETLLFENTGNRVPIESLGTRTSNAQIVKPNMNEIMKNNAIKAFTGKNPLKYAEAVKHYMDLIDISEPTAKRHIKELLEAGVLQKNPQGEYLLATNTICESDNELVEEIQFAA